jgi:hypothetical protein
MGLRKTAPEIRIAEPVGNWAAGFIQLAFAGVIQRFLNLSEQS